MANSGVNNQRIGLNNIYIGIVESLSDKYDRGAIKVRILPSDKNVPSKELPYAFPLLPKVFHVRPKVGEAVLILTLMSNAPKSQRFYIGPLISQWQFLENEDGIHGIGGLNKTPFGMLEGVSTIGDADGSLPSNDDVALIGRGKTDIILSKNDLEIRCGARLTEPFVFNSKTPAFIKLRYYEQPLSVKVDNTPKKVNNVVNVVGEYVNILSTEGDCGFRVNAGQNTSDKKTEMLNDDMIKKMIETAHPLPYGDELVNFLLMFFKAFLTHTHNYSNMPTVPDMNIEELLNNYTTVEKTMRDKMLSKYIRIN